MKTLKVNAKPATASELQQKHHWFKLWGKIELNSETENLSSPAKVLLSQLMQLPVLLITLRCSSDLHNPAVIILLVLVSLSSSPKRLLLSFCDQMKTRWGG